VCIQTSPTVLPEVEGEVPCLNIAAFAEATASKSDKSDAKELEVLAKLFDVGRTQISRIKNNHQWSYT